MWTAITCPLTPGEDLELGLEELVSPDDHDGQGANRQAGHGDGGGSLANHSPGELGILKAVQSAKMTCLV